MLPPTLARHVTGSVDRGLVVLQREEMHGLKPDDLQHLTHLRAAEVTQICVGPHDIQFNFHPSGNVSVQGRCELLDFSGDIVDDWEHRTLTGVFRFPEILMTPVIDVRIDT